MSSAFPIAALKKSSALEFRDIVEIISRQFKNIKVIEDKVSDCIDIMKEHRNISKVNFADMINKSSESVSIIRESTETQALLVNTSNGSSQVHK